MSQLPWRLARTVRRGPLALAVAATLSLTLTQMAWSQSDQAASQEKTSPEGNRLFAAGASAYQQGRTAQAAQLWSQATALFSRELGEDHPYTLVAMNNLAAAYNNLRQHDKAKPLIEQALKIRRAKLGHNHPDTLASLNNLAETLRALGQNEEALAAGLETVNRMQASLGESHVNTLLAMSNLATTYGSLGQHDKALPLREQTLKIRRAKFGDNHPNTRESLESLAATRDALNQLSQQQKAPPPKEEAPVAPTAKLAAPPVATPKSEPAPQEKAAPAVSQAPAPRAVTPETPPPPPQAVTPTAATASLAPTLKSAPALTEKPAPRQEEVPAAPVAKRDTPPAVAPTPAPSPAPSPAPAAVPTVTTAAVPTAAPSIAPAPAALPPTREPMLAPLAAPARSEPLAAPPTKREEPPLVAAVAPPAPAPVPAPASIAVAPKSEPAPPPKLAVPKEPAPPTPLAKTEPPPVPAPTAARPVAAAPAKSEVVSRDKAPAVKDDAPLQKSTKLGAVAANTLLATSNQAAAFGALGQHDKALALIPGVIADVEKQRSSPALSGDRRQGPFAEYADRYRQYARSYASARRLDEAFSLADTAKSHTLLDSLNAPTAPGLAPVAARQARQLLREGEIFVSYVLDKSGMAQAFVVGADGAVKWVDLGTLKHPAKSVAAYLKLVSPGADEDAQVVALKDGGYEWLAAAQPLPEGAVKLAEPLKALNRYWHEALIKPLLPLTGASRRWLISPDKDLALLPFDLLAESFDASGKVAQTLVNARTISLVQNFSLLAQLKQREAEYATLTRPKQLLALGHAVYGEGWETQRGLRRGSSRWYERIAGEPTSTGVAAAQPLEAEQTARRRLAWRNLPGTEHEVLTVGKLFEGQAAGADLLLGAEASEARLRQLDKAGRLKDYRYLLFSTHAYIGENPELSGLVLSQQGNPPELDGYLGASEWARLGVKSDLAVLSGYDARTARTQAGDSTMGLPYALFLAGNRNTVLSLWPVDDDATAEFMRRFFSKLASGAAQADALQQTKHEFKAHFLWGEPRFWAAFVLYGL